MRKTPLYDEHVGLGAKMVDFNGWALPLQFRGIIEEHHHTRSKVSLFDCSHMGEVRIRGRSAIERYERLVISDVLALHVGRGRYGAILNEQGGIIDDVITIRLAEDELFVVSNAGPLDKVVGAITSDNPGAEDVSDGTAKIDVQGPLARETLLKAGFPAAAGLKYFEASRTRWEGQDVVLSRMGYTGELGFEVYLPNSHARVLWIALLAVGEAAPAGLGARDTLRLEMGYPLSGQDFDETRTPLEASQGMFVAWDSEFAGKDALLAQRDADGYQVLTGIRTRDRRATRHGSDLYALSSKLEGAKEEVVGFVTSGAFGPSLGYGVGLAYLDQTHALPGTPLAAGPKRIEIETVVLPHYKSGTCRK